MAATRKIKTLYNIIKYRLLESSYSVGGSRIKYLYYDDAKSDTLLICFAAFPPKNFPVYNNVRGFKDLPVDRLYIADTFGFRASYYLYENGDDTPKRLTEALINHIVEKGGYKHIYTAGTSKGGTSAIYYGLKYNAEHIFSGACQYNLGTFLSAPVHIPILKAMMNSTDQQVIDFLNSIMCHQLESHYNSQSLIHLIYSTEENTYQNHTIDLITKLDECGIKHVDTVLDFTNHNHIGKYFQTYVLDFFHI